MNYYENIVQINVCKKTIKDMDLVTQATTVAPDDARSMAATMASLKAGLSVVLLVLSMVALMVALNDEK